MFSQKVSFVIKFYRLALMFFSPEGLFGALLARHREMGVGVGGGWEDGGRSEGREARRDK